MRLQKILDERVLGESTSINEKKFTIQMIILFLMLFRLLSDAEGTNIEMDSFGFKPYDSFRKLYWSKYTKN